MMKRHTGFVSFSGFALPNRGERHARNISRVTPRGVFFLVAPFSFDALCFFAAMDRHERS
jgi:hypothetical protein